MGKAATCPVKREAPSLALAPGYVTKPVNLLLSAAVPNNPNVPAPHKLVKDDQGCLKAWVAGRESVS